MNVSMRTSVTIGAAFGLALTANTALAGGFALREQSSYYQGTSFAGSAAGGTLSSMFWNPAALGMVGDGLTNEAVFNFIVPTSDVTVTNVAFPATVLGVTPGARGDIGIDAFVPASYGAYRLNDRIALGFSVNGPFGLATKYDLLDNIRPIAGTSEVFSLNVAPTVAISVMDGLTLAVGAQVQYIDVRYSNTVVDLNGDDIGFGFTAGLLWEIVDGTTFGIGVRSSVEHNLEGTAVRGPIGVTPTPGTVTPIRIEDFKTPEIVTASLEQRVSDAFRVSATVEWTNWSRVGTFPVLTSTGAPYSVNLGLGASAVNVPLEYDDGWYFAVGGEYDVTDEFTLRAGVGYEWSPVNDTDRGLRLPDDDRLWLSAGMSYEVFDRVRLDAGYSFISVSDTVVPGTFSANNGVTASSEGHVHIFTFGLNVALGGH